MCDEGKRGKRKEVLSCVSAENVHLKDTSILLPWSVEPPTNQNRTPAIYLIEPARSQKQKNREKKGGKLERARVFIQAYLFSAAKESVFYVGQI